MQALVLSSWMFFTHTSFSYLNAKKSFYLFKLYFKLTQELPAKSDRDYKVAGLSVEENKSFWRSEQRFNDRYYRFLGFALYGVYVVYCSVYFLIRFETNLIVFLLVQTINSIYTSYFIYLCLHSNYTLNLLYFESMRFFCLRFKRIAERVESLSRSKTKRINRKLFRLISEHNTVNFELIQINKFFKASVSLITDQ